MRHRPKGWSDFIGQEEAVTQLQIAARSARNRDVPMPHTLIHSPVAGLGKTALAELVHAEVGGNLFIETERLTTPRARPLLLSMEPRDILFLDEIHLQFPTKDGAGWLLRLLEAGVISGPAGEEPAPPITVIGATTDVGKLTKPYLRRFEQQVQLAPYTDEQAARVGAKLSEQILAGLTMPTRDVLAAIARAASNTPGDIERVLCQLRDLVWSEEILEGIDDGNYPVERALAMAGLTPDGLTARDVQYMKVLLVDFRGEPVGATQLRARLSEVGDGLNQTENRLRDRELIAWSKQGRMLTRQGIQRTRELLAAA